MKNAQEEIREIEHRLLQEHIEFSGAFLNIKNLDFLIKKHPECISETSIEPLISIINNDTFGKQRQAYFLYRETSKVLIHMSVFSESDVIQER